MKRVAVFVFDGKVLSYVRKERGGPIRFIRLEKTVRGRSRV